VTTGATTVKTAGTIEAIAGRTAATAGSTSAVRPGIADAFRSVGVRGPFCSSAMWSPNIADPSRHWRVCAANVIDQGGKNVPAQPTNFSTNCVRPSRGSGLRMLLSRIAWQLSHLI
jgi:hypothetical protein